LIKHDTLPLTPFARRPPAKHLSQNRSKSKDFPAVIQPASLAVTAPSIFEIAALIIMNMLRTMQPELAIK
jgi:hypothetical protein